MNNKLRFLRRSLVAALFCVSAGLTAQPVSPVDQSNLSEFMDDMQQYFRDIMQVGESQIADFVDGFIVGGTNAACAVPMPVMTSQDENQVSFEWPVVGNGMYKVGYLDLMTGQQGEEIITAANHSFSLPDGLYAFGFQSGCNQLRSSLTIIIYDKVVAITAVPTLDCDCTKEVWMNAEGLYFPAQEYNEFGLMISSVQNDLYQLHFRRACPECEDFIYNADCLGNLNVINEHNIDYLEWEQNPIATVAFTGPDMELGLSLPLNYSAYVKVCSQQKETLSLQADITVAPLGNQQFSIRKAAAAKEGSRKFYLCNQAGQVLSRWEQPADHPYEDRIDLAAYPPGIYYLGIADAEGRWVEKLVVF